jgi:uridylate kinase
VAGNQIIVVKLSGSLFFSEDFGEMVDAIKDALKKKPLQRTILVAGGGKKAREYIQVASEAGADQTTLDEIGIMVSRINALVLASALGEFSEPKVPRSLEQLIETLRGPAQAIVIGGLHPGQSTNAVGALVAEKVRAKRFVNATDVDGVYTKDPKKFKNEAKLLDRLTPIELEEIIGKESMKAGNYDLMDPVALKLLERSKIDTWIVKCEPKTLESAILGKRLGGTEIFHD